MSVWWLAIAENEGHATYQQLKERRVVAQGWPDLGDLRMGDLLSCEMRRKQIDLDCY